jgi:hypothetical protein
LTITNAEIERALAGIGRVLSDLEGNAARTIAGALGALGETAGDPVPYLPPPRPCRSIRRVYAFLTHPTRPEDVGLSNPGLDRLTPVERDRFLGFVAGLPPVVVCRARSCVRPPGRRKAS